MTTATARNTVLHVSNDAIRRRLDYERASHAQRELVLHLYRDFVEETIRNEVAQSRLLLPDARRVLIDPRFEARLGQRLPMRKRTHSPAMSWKPASTVGGDRYLYADAIVYIVANNTVLSMHVPTPEELDSLEQVMKAPFDVLPPLVRITDLTRDLEPSSEPRAKIIQAAPPEILSKRVDARTSPRQPTSWTYMVLDDLQATRGRRTSSKDDGGFQTNEALVRTAANWLRKTYGERLPEPIYVDALPPDLMEIFRRRFRFCRIMPLPTPPEVDWTEVRSWQVPKRARRWCTRILRLNPVGNNLVTFVTPETARIIVRSLEASRIIRLSHDPRVLRPGTVLQVHPA